MAKNVIIRLILVILFFGSVASASAQKATPKEVSEIRASLDAWNNASGEASIEKMLALFDDSGDILVVGSAKGEIFRGKEEIKGWMSQLYSFAGFSWEIDRLDVDCNGKTAWVFIDGSMVLKFHKGGTRKTPYRFTGIMVKKKGSWKWRLFDGSVPQAE